MYDIKFDRKNKNSIIIKKDDKIIRVIALPPSYGCDIIDFNGNLHKGYNYNTDCLVIFKKSLGNLLYHNGVLLDYIKK